MEVQREIHEHMLAFNVKPTDDFADLYKIHEHLLVWNDEHIEDGVENLCDECGESIRGPFYSCNRCQIFLHEDCVELPEFETDHPLHPDHPLRLTPLTSKVCVACSEEIVGLGYCCEQQGCIFTADNGCGLIGHTIKQQVVGRFHKHPLRYLPKKRASFLCDGCGKKHEDASFLCTTCGFWVGQGCALLPKTVSRRDHRHPLTLVYSHQSRYSSAFFKPNCKICNKEVNLRYWVYCCAFAKCRYFAHPYCAETEDDVSRDLELEVASENPDPKPISLPWLGELRSVYAYSIEEIILQGRKQEVKEIDHGSHEHPLILYDIQIDEESSLRRKWAKVSEKSDKVCDGCSEVILSPFYGCSKCNYFLHKWCAELPETIDSPCHPEHTLRCVSFQSPFHKKRTGLFECSCCEFYCTGFLYGCRICSKWFDIKCVSLPGEITHEAHSHTHASHCALQLRESYNVICRACGRGFSGSYAYVCDICDFMLDLECVALPGQVWHRYDKEHPFILRYSPVEGTNEYFCEICEGKIDAKTVWFYHCSICDQSLHTECICPFNPFSNNVKVGSKVWSSLHGQHILSVVGNRKTNYARDCPCCGRIVELSEKAVECDKCNVGFHVDCVYLMNSAPLLHLLNGRALESDDE